jgi:hypothetical protein
LCTIYVAEVTAAEQSFGRWTKEEAIVLAGTGIYCTTMAQSDLGGQENMKPSST